jgi:hypothetical protein
VSFASTPDQDVSGIVLRLRPGRVRRVEVDFGPESDGGAEAKASPAGSLRGRVFDARSKEAVVAFAISVWRREGLALESVTSASFVDPSGWYEIDGLEPGTYEATAMAAGYAAARYAVVEVADSQATADFSLRGGARLSGMVREGSTGTPVAGAAVWIEGRRGQAPDLPVALVSPETETGADGRFALDHVPPDSLGLRVRKKGFVLRMVSLGSLPEEGEATPFAIDLTPGDDDQFELTGIGAALQARGDGMRFQGMLPGGGAAAAGLMRGDELLAIDGVPVAGLGYEGALAAIRGPAGTTVTLHIRRAGREMDVVVTRTLVRG